MVGFGALVGRVAVRDRLAGFLERNIVRGTTARGARTLGTMSIREISRRTGVARSTIQDFLAGPTRARQGTFDRMASLLGDPRLQESSRGLRTAFVDAPLFTPDSIASLRIPPEATAVRLISEALASPGREMGSTPWLDIDLLDDFISELPGGLESLQRIVFDVG